MRDILVGYSGFVGSNLCIQKKFEMLCNSQNVLSAYGKNPTYLYYAGVPAKKFLANQFPQKDELIIENAINNIKNINPQKIVLISTVDVYDVTSNATEETKINSENLCAYGANRLLLENYIENNYNDYLIVRLPALFGKNLKKNFIYDIIHPIPKMLTAEKYDYLISLDNHIRKYYSKGENEIYICNAKTKIEQVDLLLRLKSIGFSAINFTDSRSKFQFYNLDNLSKDIKIALDHKIKIVNFTVEPISAAELYEYIKGESFVNYIGDNYAQYDINSQNTKLYNNSKYMYDKQYTLSNIKKFVEDYNV